jgi:radical SAM enzyme (TIGR01210 family)
MIKEFEKITGIPVVLNTSFNVKEPIVCSPEDAVNTYLKSNIDYLAIGDFIAHKTTTKVSWSGLEDINFGDKKCKKLMTILISTGCEWASKGRGPCTMCNFWIQYNKNIKSSDIINQFKKEVKKYDFKKEDIREVCIFNSGSFFNDHIIPEKVRSEIMKTIADYTSVKNVVVESRPEFITEKKVRKLKEILGNKDLEVAIGLESSDDFIREKIIRKGFTLKEFEKAARILKKAKANLRVYVLIKPIILREDESIKDAIKTSKYVFNLGKKLKIETEVQLEPVYVKPPSLVFTAWKMDQYRAVWLWSVIEIIKKVSKHGKIHVGINSEGMNWNDMPRNCDKCTDKVIEAIKKFNADQKTSHLDKVKCDCISKWKNYIEEKPQELNERVKSSVIADL